MERSTTGLKLFRLSGDEASEVPGAGVRLERQLQAVVERNMEIVLGIRFLASEYVTGRHQGRIDSLGLDLQQRPVVVEYKRDRDRAVLTQGLSYLSWLQDHRPEFEQLVERTLGVPTAKGVDWRAPRLVVIAQAFQSHDVAALDVIDRAVDLVTYRMFGADLLALQTVASAGRLPQTLPSMRVAAVRRAAPAVKVTASVRLASLPQPLRDLFADLDAMLLGHAGVERQDQQHYFAYRTDRNVATVRVQPRSRALVVNLRVDPDSVELREGFTRDVRGLGYLGTGDLEVRIRSGADLADASDLVSRSVDGS